VVQTGQYGAERLRGYRTLTLGEPVEEGERAGERRERPQPAAGFRRAPLAEGKREARGEGGELRLQLAACCCSLAVLFRSPFCSTSDTDSARLFCTSSAHLRTWHWQPSSPPSRLLVKVEESVQDGVKSILKRRRLPFINLYLLLLLITAHPCLSEQLSCEGPLPSQWGPSSHSSLGERREQ
jgi:hypothetical protein